MFLLIHHYGKGSSDESKPKPIKERMRGSSALFDAMQTTWGLEARDKDDFTRLSLGKDRLTNVRDFEFGVKFVDNALDESVVLQHLDIEQMKGPTAFDVLKGRIIELVKKEPGLSKNGIEARVTGNRQKCLQAIDELTDPKRGKVVLQKDQDGGYRAV